EITSSNFSFEVMGPANSYWDLYESSDFESWELVGGVSLNQSAARFTRTGLTGVAHRFYRASYAGCCSQPIGFTRETVKSNSYAMIANQFDASANTIGALLNNSEPNYLPAGVQISKWNGSSWDAYTYSVGAWRDGSMNPANNISLAPGEGG